MIDNETDERRQKSCEVAAGVQDTRRRRRVGSGGQRRALPIRPFGELRESKAEGQQQHGRNRV